MARSLEDQLRARARNLGFDGVAITSAEAPVEWGDRLNTMVANGWHGTMDWLAETTERRKSPTAMWPQARSAIILSMNYGPQGNPLTRLEERDAGVISVYALNRDYHDLIKGKLKDIAQWLARQAAADVKVFVDTAPLMEKPLAQAGGLGWQGKHTNLVSRELGSWLFLGAILTSANLKFDAAETDHCGQCRACLDICPTRAFPAPFQLDARRCISYLTIEHKGHIDRSLRAAMGNRIYGCDDCLAVCPWNKFASAASQNKLAARDDLIAPQLKDLALLDDAAFRKLFTVSPVKRIGRNRFVRNVLIAIGNSGNQGLALTAEQLLSDSSPLVRAMAVWALTQLCQADGLLHLKTRYLSQETDIAVMAEWRQAG